MVINILATAWWCLALWVKGALGASQWLMILPGGTAQLFFLFPGGKDIKSPLNSIWCLHKKKKIQPYLTSKISLVLPLSLFLCEMPSFPLYNLFLSLNQSLWRVVTTCEGKIMRMLLIVPLLLQGIATTVPLTDLWITVHHVSPSLSVLRCLFFPLSSPPLVHLSPILSSVFPFPLISQWHSPQLASLKVFPPAV